MHRKDKNACFLVNFSAGCCVFKDFSILLQPNSLYLLHNYCIGSVGLVFYKKQKNNTFMKKLFSIVCAAVMVLSASAAPQFATRVAKKNMGGGKYNIPRC